MHRCCCLLARPVGTALRRSSSTGSSSSRWHGSSRRHAPIAVRCSSSGGGDSSGGGESSTGDDVPFKGFDRHRARKAAPLPKDLKELSTPDALVNTLAGAWAVWGGATPACPHTNLPPPRCRHACCTGWSDAQGRLAGGNNIILGASDSEDKWRQLDEQVRRGAVGWGATARTMRPRRHRAPRAPRQVNVYPGTRTFKAIGTGGDDFVQAMERCVSSVVGTVHAECVNTRLSTKGNYVSVTISVWIETPDQALAIYELMKQDGRLRFFF